MPLDRDETMIDSPVLSGTVDQKELRPVWKVDCLPPAALIRVSLILMFRGLIRENPVIALNLGLCSVIAATGTLTDAMIMSCCVVSVICLAAALISLFRNLMSQADRLMVTLGLLGTLVSVSTLAVQALWPETHQRIGPYLSLVVTNCIILGRLDSFARFNRLLPALMDSLGHGVGYSLVIIGVAFLRWFIQALIGPSGAGLESLPAWAFLISGLFIGLVRGLFMGSEKSEADS